MEKLKNYFYERGDVYCNQKYGDYLPYSFHLKCVEQQGAKFLHLIDFKVIQNKENQFSQGVTLGEIVSLALTAHEAIEDFRMTYNDVKEIASGLGNSVAGEMVADIVYCVTDEKGKIREERKNDKYYKELSENKLAVFVKLADLSANTLFSKLTGSSMYVKYKKEFPKFKEEVYVPEYESFFNYVENL
jgi:hypothetical protein